MTTTVTVKCISSNPGKGAIVTDKYGSDHELAPGEEATFHLHDSNDLVVREGAIAVPATKEPAQVPADPAPAESEASGGTDTGS